MVLYSFTNNYYAVIYRLMKIFHFLCIKAIVNKNCNLSLSISDKGGQEKTLIKIIYQLFRYVKV